MATEVITYTADFFCGANVGIWIKDVLIVEAAGIEFSAVQTKKPIFGWASQLYNGVAQGIVQASGTMYLNFREAHLFNALIDHAHSVSYDSDTYLYSNSDNVQYNQASYSPDKIVSSINNLTQEQIDQFKAAYWQQSTQAVPQVQPISSQQVFQVRNPIRRPDDHTKGFDIHITYGDYINKTTSPTNKYQEIPATMRNIMDVQVTGYGQTIEIDGRPILEAYNFFARQVI